MSDSFQKWLFKKKYLDIEHLDTKTKHDIYVSKFNEKFSKFIFCKENMKQTTQQKPEDNCEECANRNDDRETSETVKKLYRKLSQKLHPDKNPDNEEKFVELQEAYESDNLLHMLDMAEQTDIPVKLEEKDINILRKNIEELETKIKIMINSYAWIYYEGPLNKKNMLLMKLTQLWGEPIN